MGILEKIGLKKKTATEPKAHERKTAQAEVPKELSQQAPEKTPRVTSAGYNILLKPVLSEKGTSLAGSGKYVFAVHPKANKTEIRKAIQRIYEVHVESVKIIKMPSKFRRYGKTFGSTSPWKKAVVSVRKGEKISGIIEAVG